MDSLIFRVKIILKVIGAYIFYFPGLVLHEGSHALAAIITLSKITKISLFPSIQFAPDDSSYKVTYGYVRSVSNIKAAYMLIGLAPLFLWLIPLYIATNKQWIDLTEMGINFTLMLDIKNWWFFYLLFQITWAGIPSRQDWKVFLEGLLSVSTAILAIILYILYFGSISLDKSQIWKILP